MPLEDHAGELRFSESKKGVNFIDKKRNEWFTCSRAHLEEFLAEARDSVEFARIIREPFLDATAKPQTEEKKDAQV